VDQPDQHLQERYAEKTADLESLADALAAFRHLNRDLDQWRGFIWRLVSVQWSGCYGNGAVKAALALTPEMERGPNRPGVFLTSAASRRDERPLPEIVRNLPSATWPAREP